MDEILFFFEDRLVTLVVSILLIAYIAYKLFYKDNWRFIKIRNAGFLIRFGKEVEEDGKKVMYGPGLLNINSPIETLKTIKMHDIQLAFSEEVPTGAPNSQNVLIVAVVTLRVFDPTLAILAVPDADPVDEFVQILKSAFMGSVQMFTIYQIFEPNAQRRLAEEVAATLHKSAIPKRWGLEIIEVNISDINPGAAWLAAAAKVIEANAEAESKKAVAEGEKAAYSMLKEIMGADYMQVLSVRAAEQMGRSGAFHTVVTAKNLFDFISGGGK